MVVVAGVAVGVVRLGAELVGRRSDEKRDVTDAGGGPPVVSDAQLQQHWQTGQKGNASTYSAGLCHSVVYAQAQTRFGLWTVAD